MDLRDNEILPSPIPQSLPALKLETVGEFLPFKQVPVNSPSKTGPTASNIQVKDVFGNVMFTEGCWKAPKMEMIHYVAITDI
jgi:hypothetical protein